MNLRLLTHHLSLKFWKDLCYSQNFLGPRSRSTYPMALVELAVHIRCHEVLRTDRCICRDSARLPARATLQGAKRHVRFSDGNMPLHLGKLPWKLQGEMKGHDTLFHRCKVLEHG